MKRTLIYLTLLLTTSTPTLTAQLVEIGNNSPGAIKVYGGEWTGMPRYEEIEQTARWNKIVQGTENGIVPISEWSDFPNEDKLLIELDGKTNLVIVYEGVVDNEVKQAIAFVAAADCCTEALWVYFKALSPKVFYAITSSKEVNWSIEYHTHPH